MLSSDTVWKMLSALESLANWKKQKIRLKKIRTLVSSVLQNLTTPPKTIAQSSDKVANFWQSSEHMQREMRNDWYVYTNVRIQNVIAAEVRKQPYDP